MHSEDRGSFWGAVIMALVCGAAVKIGEAIVESAKEAYYNSRAPQSERYVVMRVPIIDEIPDADV